MNAAIGPFEKRFVRKWARGFTANLLASGHVQLALRAMQLLEARGYHFAAEARRTLQKEHPRSAA